jgi:hypothetical protein
VTFFPEPETGKKCLPFVAFSNKQFFNQKVPPFYTLMSPDKIKQCYADSVIVTVIRSNKLLMPTIKGSLICL